MGKNDRPSPDEESNRSSHADLIQAGVMTVNQVRAAEGLTPLRWCNSEPVALHDDASWSRIIMDKVVPRAVVLSLIAMTFLSGYPMAGILFSGITIAKELGFDKIWSKSNG